MFQSLGNHEFDVGVGGLIPFIHNLVCPVLAANLILNKVPELATEPNLMNTIVFNISGNEVGVIGYLTPKTKNVAVKNDVEYEDEIIALRREVAVLKKKGVNIIIALGHSGYERDQEIAEQVEDLDLVIGGHSHTFLGNGTSPDQEIPLGPYPTYVMQASGRTVPVVQAYAFNKYMGKIHTVFNPKGEMVSLDGRPILLDQSIPQDPEILTILDRYRDKIQNVSNEVIGNTSIVLDNSACEKSECNLGNLITDAMVYKYATHYKGEHWTDAPIATIQAGGVRASISHLERPMMITKGDLLTVMPFKGYLAAVSMNGSVLLQMLEHSAGSDSTVTEEFLQFSGLKVVYNISRPIGSRVVAASARCWACDIPSYNKVQDKQIYKVLMPDFMSNGGDGYSMLTNLPTVILPYNELLCTQEYVRRHSPVFPEIEGRIITIREDLGTDSAELTSLSFTVALFSALGVSLL